MPDRTVRQLVEESHDTAVEKGWWEEGVGNRPLLEQLMLMVTELAEAAEEVRSGHQVGDTYYSSTRNVTDEAGVVLPKPEGFMAELADVYIRIGDTIGAYGLTDSFLLVLDEKLRYNKSRPYRHGGKTA